MQPYEERLARSVWSRVQGKTPPAPPAPMKPNTGELCSLVPVTAQLSRNLFLLSQRTGRYRASLQQMSRRYQKYTGVLRGICRLQQGNPPPLPPQSGERITPSDLCRSCIGALQTLHKLCNQREGTAFPHIFADICGVSRQDLSLLLEIFSAL